MSFNITTLPTKENEYNCTEITSIYNTLQEIIKNLPEVPSYSHQVSNADKPIFELSKLAYAIEKIVLPLCYEYLLRFKRNLSKNQIIEDLFIRSHQIGLVIYYTKEENFMIPETEDPVKNWSPKALPAMAENLKQNRNNKITLHFIFNKLVVQTNSAPTFETFIKLKILEFTLLKPVLESPVIEKLIDLYKALLDNDVTTFNNILNELIDLKEIKRRKYIGLQNQFKSDKETRLNQLKNRISNIRKTISDYEKALHTYFKDLKDNLHEYNVIEQQEDNFDFDILLNYLIKHPYLTNIEQYDDHRLILTFENPINYFDVSLGKQTTRHYRELKRFAAETLMNPRFTVWVTCKIVFNTRTFEVQRYRTSNGPKYYAHPHINEYGCFGNHDREIQKWIDNLDYIGAIEQISAACQNLNFTDSIVLSTFTETIKDYSHIPSFFDNEKQKFVTFNEIKNELYNKE